MIPDIVIMIGVFALGFLCGYRFSHEVYGKMIDDGKLLFKSEEEWDGTDDAMYDAKHYLGSWHGRTK
jgi:hypothetical protein